MSKTYKTFSEEYCIEDARLLPRLKRNMRLLQFLFKTFLAWFKARKVRAEFEHARKTNQPFYVDRFERKK